MSYINNDRLIRNGYNYVNEKGGYAALRQIIVTYSNTDGEALNVPPVYHVVREGDIGYRTTYQRFPLIKEKRALIFTKKFSKKTQSATKMKTVSQVSVWDEEGKKFIKLTSKKINTKELWKGLFEKLPYLVDFFRVEPYNVAECYLPAPAFLGSSIYEHNKREKIKRFLTHNKLSVYSAQEFFSTPTPELKLKARDMFVNSVEVKKGDVWYEINHEETTLFEGEVKSGYITRNQLKSNTRRLVRVREEAVKNEDDSFKTFKSILNMRVQREIAC